MGSLGAGHSYQEDRNPAQEAVVLRRRRTLKAASAAHKARTQELRLLQVFLSSFQNGDND